MIKNAISAIVCALCAVLLCEPHSFGQSLSGSSLNIFGSSTLNALNVTGTAGLQGNLSVAGSVDVLSGSLFFGTVIDAGQPDNGQPGISALYTDGPTSTLNMNASRSAHQWLWGHQSTSGTNISMMKLDSSHRLSLFSPSNSTNPIIVLDPSLGQITVNGLALGQGSGFGLVSGGNGSTASSNSIAVGDHANANGSASAAFGTQTTASGASQFVVGQHNIAVPNAIPGVVSGSDALFIIGNGTAGSPHNALTVNALGQLQLFASGSNTPTLILDPSTSGTSTLPGTVSMSGTVLLTPQGDVGMGQYATGTQGNSGSAHVQVFPTGIQVSGTSTIGGKTSVSGTLDLSNTAVVGFSGVPTGAVICVATGTAPAGWLECNGAAISRATYAALFAAVGTTYGTGDGSTTFNLPDIRGEFIRGWDHSRGVDSGRAIGTSQADELKSHVHSIANDGWYVFGAGSSVLGYAARYNGGATGATGGNETRPRNIALMYCIKY